MMPRTASSSLALLGLGVSMMTPMVVSDGLISHTEAFRQMAGGMCWPVQSDDRSLIGSTFGPRISACTGEYDFHHGVSIHGKKGDKIFASYDGKVVTIKDSLVILEHKFPGGQSIEFNGVETSQWYSLYDHLGSVQVAVGDEVKACDWIGLMGSCHCAHGALHQFTQNHLEHEIRIGSRCSYKHSKENPGSTCNTLGIDPHVHPMLAYEHLDTIQKVTSTGTTEAKAVTFIEEVVPGLMETSFTSVLRIRTDDEQPNINSYQVACTGITASQLTHREHVIDLNHRTGFYLEDLDTPDTSVPFLIPVRFGKNKDFWETQLMIPSGWFPPTDIPPQCDLYVTDVWGNVEHLEISHGVDQNGGEFKTEFTLAHSYGAPCDETVSAGSSSAGPSPNSGPQPNGVPDGLMRSSGIFAESEHALEDDEGEEDEHPEASDSLTSTSTAEENETVAASAPATKTDINTKETPEKGTKRNYDNHKKKGGRRKLRKNVKK